jgi:hypothetical protein
MFQVISGHSFYNKFQTPSIVLTMKVSAVTMTVMMGIIIMVLGLMTMPPPIVGAPAKKCGNVGPANRPCYNCCKTESEYLCPMSYPHK